jgi:hypothetical protein
MVAGLELFQTLPENSDIQAMRLCFTLQYWCVWQAQEANTANCWPSGKVLPMHGGQADVSYLPMMQSRRLSPLARAVCAVTWETRQACGDMPAVYFSRHGESHYYFEMLQDLAGGAEVSPSRFSLSVHNAIAGLCSFHGNSFQPYVSLAGGAEGLFAAFLDAAGMLLETSTVLLVCYEQALPEVYQAYLADSEITCVLALVLSRAEGGGPQLQLTRKPNNRLLNREYATQDLIESMLAGQRSAVCQLNQSIWQWRLDDA